MRNKHTFVRAKFSCDYPATMSFVDLNDKVIGKIRKEFCHKDAYKIRVSQKRVGEFKVYITWKPNHYPVEYMVEETFLKIIQPYVTMCYCEWSQDTLQAIV